MTDTNQPALTRAQRRAAKRARRNDPATKARRYARRNARQRMALDRLETINPFDVAVRVSEVQ